MSSFLDVILEARAQKKTIISPHVAKWVIYKDDEPQEYHRQLTKKFIFRSLSHLTTAEAVEVDDIAEAVFTGGNGYHFPASFPLCMPPFEHTFFGFRRPSRFEGEFELEVDRKTDPVERARLCFPSRTGVLVVRSTYDSIIKRLASPEADPDAVDEVFKHTLLRQFEAKGLDISSDDSLNEVTENYLNHLEEGSVFFCHATVFIDPYDFMPEDYAGPRYEKGMVLGPLCTMTWSITKTGEMVGEHSFQAWTQDEKTVDLMWRSFYCIFWPAFLSISLLNAKNVKLDDVSPPKKLNLRREKKGKAPLLTYKRLVITPMEARRSAAKAESDGRSTPKSEHLVRGHFGDYTKGKGLFGRTKGLFWFMDHKRGSPEAGAVVKDYEVKPEKDPE